MTSSDFVKKLKLVTPSRNDLLEFGFDEDFIEIYINSFNLSKRTNESVTKNPLLDLIFKYDVDDFEVSMIRFYQRDEVIDVEEYILFGVFDADILAIEKSTEEIVVVDWEEPDRIIQYVAKDSTSFLNCLLRIAEFNKEMFFDEILSENQEEILKKSLMISELAGGDKYLHFYFTVFGYVGASDSSLN